ncbi:sulfite exporter TauE/SafE family protein [Dyadobacter sediminis]|uniref:Sulfite exporter TauE/SafE family protein n=2 Tax=Dyadobacter sediminis TaxID=1493691 RepID=A0A5R9KLD2_9BACT|nr:sulfite exporter TauE/SafE family protein [Dyadobacter sediminis]
MGLLSSFHCIGMCGPIALALPDQAGNRWRKVNGLLLYNTGRALSYAMLGAVVGLLGNVVAWMGYLNYLSVIAGMGMLGYVLWPKNLGLWLHPPAIWSAVITCLKKKMSGVLQSRKMRGRFFLGILNGLLPCGLVYLALASSAATGNVPGAAMYMFIFGLGTLPMMLAIGLFKNRFTPSLRSRFHRFTPVVIAIAGCWLVLRGVLIRYPQNDRSHAAQITICHGK